MKLQLKCMLLTCLLSSSGTLVAAGDAAVLTKLYRADQSERNAKTANWAELVQNDRKRVALVKQLLAKAQIKTAADFIHAATILNHGRDVDDFRLANAVATLGLAQYPRSLDLQRMYANTWDRMMLAQNRPQWYGTQYAQAGDAALWQLDPVDPLVTDQARLALGLPSICEVQEKIAALNVDLKKRTTAVARPANFQATVFAAKDQQTINALLQLDPALAQFWLRLAEFGLPQPLSLGQKIPMQIGFHALNKTQLLAYLDGDKSVIQANSSADACFVKFDALANPDLTLTLNLGIDCKVTPGPVLSIRPDTFFRLQLSGLNDELQAKQLNLISVERVYQ